MTPEEEIAQLRAKLAAAEERLAGLDARRSLQELLLEHRQMQRTPYLMLARQLKGLDERGLVRHLCRCGFPDTTLEDVLSWELEPESLPAAVLDHLSVFFGWPKAGLLHVSDGPPLRWDDTSLRFKGRKFLDIGCDGPHENPEETIQTFRSEEAAIEAGWTLGDGWDLCPICTRTGVNPPAEGR